MAIHGQSIEKQRLLELEAPLFHHDIFGPASQSQLAISSTNMAILDLACGLHCWTHVHVQTPGQKANLLASASNQRAHINREQS